MARKCPQADLKSDISHSYHNFFFVFVFVSVISHVSQVISPDCALQEQTNIGLNNQCGQANRTDEFSVPTSWQMQFPREEIDTSCVCVCVCLCSPRTRTQYKIRNCAKAAIFVNFTADIAVCCCRHYRHCRWLIAVSDVILLLSSFDFSFQMLMCYK